MLNIDYNQKNLQIMNTPTLTLRPRFRFKTDLTRSQIVERFREELNQNNPKKFSGVMTDFHIEVKFPPERQRIWTPHLEIGLEEDLQDQKTIVRVLLAPASTIWTLIMFFTITISTAVFIGLMLGVSQMMVDNEPWAFYVVPFGLTILLILYLVARQGRTLARAEMPELKAFADQVFHCDCLQVASKYHTQ